MTKHNPAGTGKGYFGRFTVLALIVLQIGLVLVALLFVASTREQRTDAPDAAALNAPPVNAIDSTTVMPVQPLLPTVASQIVLPTLAPVIPTPQIVKQPALPSTVKVRGVEITQGIQVFNEPEDARCNAQPHHPNNIFCNNSIPLVAQRHTMMRVYLVCAADCPAVDGTIQLRLLKDGQQQVNLTQPLPAATLARISNLPLSELRFDLNNSVNFQLFPPPAGVQGDVTIEVTAGFPGHAPATATLVKNFVQRKPLRVAYVPLQYQGLTPPEPAEIDYWLQRMYPVPNVEYYRLPIADVAWQGDLNKSEILRKLLYIYWLYAQNHPVDDWPDQLFGWLPMEVYNGGISDPFWCPHCVGPHSSRVAFGGLRPEQDIGGPRILVHEIAHNLGAQHAWSPTYNQDTHCFKAEGVDIQVDPAWPYADTPYTQEFGVDLYSDPPVIYAPSYYDMMAYCTLPWVSPHTYRKIFDSPFLQPDNTDLLPVADFRPQVQAQENGALLVSGIIFPDGTVSQPEVIRLVDVASAFTPPVSFVPPPGDDYCLDVRGKNKNVLAQHCFDVGFVDMETGEIEPSPYFFTLPDTTAEDVGEVSISKNQLSLVIVTPSNHKPVVKVVRPNGGETLSGRETIIWEATDADGDSLTYDLLYSTDNGLTWTPLAVRIKQSSYTFYADQLPLTYEGLIRVIAHDGFHTAVDESDSIFTIAALQENSLSLRGPSNVSPGQTFAVTVLANGVTEPGLFGVQFNLNFDPALLQLENVSVHPDLDLVVDDGRDNYVGLVPVIASRQGRVDNLTGNLVLATITFTARQNTGQAELTLSDVRAGARGGIRLDIAEASGLSVQVTP